MEKGLAGTGTLLNRIPKECINIGDKALKKRGRGAPEMLLRRNPELAVIKWFVNEPVVTVPSAYGTEPEYTCNH